MKQAMIFAAGLGTRLKPLTDTMPKALVRVGGQPLLWHVVMKLKKAGYERIVVNVHHFANQIVDYLAEQDHFGLDIRISDETEGLLETGGGIKKALPLFDPESPILIHNYLMFDDEMRLQGWTNIETGEVKGEKANRLLAFSGVHVFHPSLAPLLADWPERFPIMDFYLKACGDHLIRGYEARDLQLLDVGKIDTLDQAETFIKQL